MLRSDGDDKLYAILLLEADFNLANKLMLGVHMMNKTEATKQTVPEALGVEKPMTLKN